MPDDMERVMQRVHDLPDRELVRMLDLDADQYTHGALSIAEEEADARGGLVHLRERAAPSLPTAAPDDVSSGDGPAWHERLSSVLIGHTPSEAYPALSYVAIGLRLFSFLFAALAVVLFSSRSYALLTGTDLSGVFQLMGLYPTVWFLLAFGASELIHVFTDAAADTRESRNLLRTLVEQQQQQDDDAS